MATATPTLWTAAEFQSVIKAPTLAATYDRMRNLNPGQLVRLGRKVYVNADKFLEFVNSGGDCQQAV